MSNLPADRFDVIVIGAGPAGVTAAIALGRSGFSVLLCEAGVFPGAENWSGAVYFTENLEHPDAFGKDLVERAPFERRLVERGAYLYNGHTLLGASLRSADVYRSCYTVLRPVYDRYLAEVAREHGVVLACETTVQSLIRHRGRVIGVHTERGSAYADVVYLAEGDASHLVTQEGYETVSEEQQAEGAPHFLQGVKEVITLPEGAIEERFGVQPGEGAAMEMLLRNASRQGRTARLNMGGFVYTNRNSLSLGFVLPLDNLREHFQGDHNLLMEWYKGLPEIARLIEGGTLTSYGAKIIRGGGHREIPRLVDDGLAIGGAASGIGLDFPYPNFTGPATGMGLWFARAVKAIASDHGGPGRKGDPTTSPYTAEALRGTYLEAVHRSHYYRNVEALRDWPAYIERTQFFFERQLDVANNVAFVMSRTDWSAAARWWETVRVVRRSVPLRKLGGVLGDLRALGGTVGIGRLVAAALTPANLGRFVWNTVRALLPSRDARVGSSEPDGAVQGAGVAEATSRDGGRLRAVFRVLGGEVEPGRPPLAFRWIWARYGGALASAFSEVYTNDDTDIGRKLAAAARHMGARASIWDALLQLKFVVLFVVLAGLQAVTEWFRHVVLKWDLGRFRALPAYRLLEENRERIRLDDSHVTVSATFEAKLGTITYQEGHRSHIKVLWPADLADRASLSDSPLWSVCPARVYEVRRNVAGQPGVVVNFDNCIKCETCWRATSDVHWSRATQQRLIYQVDTPAQTELHEYLVSRPQPLPHLDARAGFWETAGAGLPERASLPPEAAAALDLVRAGLERVNAGLGAYSDDLARSPLVLEQGRRRHLVSLLAAAAEAFATAAEGWEGEALGAVRDRGGDMLEALWADAREQFDQARGHAAGGRFFWAELVARQLSDHHLAGIGRICARFAGDHAADADTLAGGASARECRELESLPARFAAARDQIRGGLETHFDSQAVRALDHGAALESPQTQWLRAQVAACGERERGYGRRDVLLEELAGADVSLSWLLASHFLATDLLRSAGDAEGAAAAGADEWLATVHVGRRTARTLEDGTTELHAVADFVPMALATRLLVVVGSRGYLVPADGDGVATEDVGAVGLLGARVRRVRLDACVVPSSAVVDLSAQLDPVALENPAAGEPAAAVLGAALPDYLAIVRGAGEYLLGRARDHAAGRVQFPGAFQDEAGRESIAKFGAVKAMLAEMEAWRYQLEALSMASPAGDDTFTGAAAAKILASEAFGPGTGSFIYNAGSFTYNTGQLFGGTAFSEDDVIARYYRDSGPFRFLLGHDDALRVEIGRRSLRARTDGGSLVPFAQAERTTLEDPTARDLLGAAVADFTAAVTSLESWAATLPEAPDDATLAIVGDAVARALGVKVCLVRSLRRVAAGIPAESMIEACRLVARRFLTGMPAVLEEADLVADTLAAGESLLGSGDPFPGPPIADAEPYREIVEAARPHGSGEWLMGPFDPEHQRYIPEILANDEKLRSYWLELEAEFRARFVEPRFDGLIYSRYLEKLHLIPDDDLQYLVGRGFLRMPIAAELGGEGSLKAEYYILCNLVGRYGDAALVLAIMGNTSIGTVPALIGLYQDLPRAREELERVRQHPEVLGEIREGIDGVLAMMQRPDPAALADAFRQVMDIVTRRVARSMVLKYIGSGFLRAFFGAGAAGQARDLVSFEKRLRQARELLDGILDGVDERLAEYPRRARAHEQFLQMISAGYISAFALTEPTAGSDSGGVKTFARPASRKVHRDDEGVLYFFLDETAREGRRNLLDADRLVFDFDGDRMLYRYADDAEPAPIEHGEYDYAKDSPERTRFYRQGDRRVNFTDIAQIREDGEGHAVYEYWVLNGAKMWITNGRFCHCMALYALTDPEGVTGFMVDRHAEGMVVGADEEKLGQRGSPTNELSLSNVRVAREMILGFRGRGQVNALETLNTGRAGLAVTTHATIQEMVEDAVICARGDTSPLFGYEPREPVRPLELYWLGKLAEELVGAAGTTYELVGLMDNKSTSSVRMESAIGKYYGSESEHDCIDWMERLRGLEGQTWLHRIEKTRRDARVLNIYEGTNEVQRFLLLKDLVQRVGPAWKKATPAAAGGEQSPLAHPELIGQLEEAKSRLAQHVLTATNRFDQQVWANVGLQPCFFRLSEIAGLTKVIDAVLYRLEWIARHDVDEEYAGRLRRAGVLYVRRALSRIAVLERRYEAAWKDLLEGRFPPETQLGFLSLEEEGAVAEGWGRLPARLQAAPERRPLQRDLRVAVLVKPVPMPSPRPRLDDGAFAEPMLGLGPADHAALRAALDLKRRDPKRVHVAAYTLAAGVGEVVLRHALALGADSAVRVVPADGVAGSSTHDPRYGARALAAAIRRAGADLVVCGDGVVDTGQAVMPTYVGHELGCDAHAGIDTLELSATGEALMLGSEAWHGNRLEQALPTVVGVAASSASHHDQVSLGAWLRAAAFEIEELPAEQPATGLVPLSVRHELRTAVAGTSATGRATTPAEAVAVLLAYAEEAGSGADEIVQPYQERLLTLGEQPKKDAGSVVLVLEPTSTSSLTGSARADLDVGVRVAGGTELPLDVFVPFQGDATLAAEVAGAVIAAAEPRRVYVVGHPAIGGFGARGHLEWLQELWAMYRGRPQWLLGGAWSHDVLARFVAAGIPGVRNESIWSWYDADSILSRAGGVYVGTSIYGGAANAVAELPGGEGLRVVALAKAVQVEMGTASYAVPGSAESTVFFWDPRLSYDPQGDPVASLLARLGGGEPTLRDADFIIDVGYGTGGRRGLDELVEPLRRLLVEELGLPGVLVGATRKVTQDLEVLPMDRQIGQTGVPVNPKLIIALAVSGAPQHVDYIGDRAEILSFNIDPEAPLMKLNDQRPRPLIHPIVGDVFVTVPAFIDAVRERLRSRG